MHPVGGPIPITSAQPSLQVRPAPELARVDAVRDRVELSSVPGAQRLLAARVSQQIDFVPQQPAAKTADRQPTLPLYHHPADRNAAATGVDVGRRLDVVG